MRRLLVVDDDRLILTLVSRLLKEYEVTAVGAPEDALARLAAGERFDVIVSDVDMPHMLGTELYAQVVALDAGQATRFVFMSGGVPPDARAPLAESGRPLLKKPFEIDALRALLASVLPTTT